MKQIRCRPWRTAPAAFCGLETHFGRLDDWLQTRPSRPEGRNPALPSEVISSAWDDTKYANFRERVHTCRGQIDDAYDESDREESIGKWRRVFGDDFAKAVVVDEASNVSAKAVVLAESVVGEAIAASRDLVDLVTHIGARALPAGFSRLPHMRRPMWRMASQTPFQVGVTATLHASKNGARLGEVSSIEAAAQVALAPVHRSGRRPAPRPGLRREMACDEH